MMQRQLLSLAVLAAFSAAHAEDFSIESPEHPRVSTVERYELNIPANQSLAYQGRFASEFGGQLPLAVGSGLRFKGYEKDASLSFWAVTDRGPNADAPKAGNAASKIFLSPDFTPSAALINLQLAEKAEVKQLLPLQEGSSKLSGRPIPAGKTGSSLETALSDQLSTLPSSDLGIDPEGIDIDKNGNLWIADEYGPFLLNVDSKSGKVLKRFAPGAGLPAVLAQRQPNRGFEGVAVTPSGKVVSVLQSTLDINQETKGSARFIRLVELDPASGATKTYAYPMDIERYKKNGDAKIGDLVAIDDTRFLLIEQGKGKDKKLHNTVYVIDTKGATDIGSLKLDNGKELEYANAEQLGKIKMSLPVESSSNMVTEGGSSAVKMVKKNALFDLRELGWQAEKAEGLAIVGQGKLDEASELAIINDNDFGLKASVAGDEDVDSYSLDAQGKLVDNKGQAAKGELKISRNGESSQLWLLHLKAPLKDYFPK